MILIAIQDSRSGWQAKASCRSTINQRPRRRMLSSPLAGSRATARRRVTAMSSGLSKAEMEIVRAAILENFFLWPKRFGFPKDDLDQSRIIVVVRIFGK